MNDESAELLELRYKRLAFREEAEKRRRGLPHIHGHNLYPWQREFELSRNPFICLTAANQVGKSTSLQKKMVKWATTPELWPELWPKYCKPVEQGGLGEKPSQFWYLYPSANIATIEFEEKWRKILPRDEYKNDPVLGWKETYDKGDIFSIAFNSGVTIYFKSYGQGATQLQAGSIFFIGCDEELPEELFSELNARVNATDGYMAFVFTATLGQSFWKDIVEDRTKYPEAQIFQISLYDCQYYEDGTPSQWTDEKINRTIARCKSPAEVQRRVYGKFVVDEGLKYQSFEKAKNTSPYHMVPKSWLTYIGIDYGSGGTAHPASIVFLAVSPEYDRARAYKVWRGDGIGNTTAEDVVKQYLKMVRGINPVAVFFDWACKDMGVIASRMGMNFQRAEKSHDIGEMTLNTLFKSGALKIYTKSSECIEPEFLQSEKLVTELETLLEKTAKNSAKDDAVDALRYAASSVPWDFEAIAKIKEATPPPIEITEMDRRRGIGDDDELQKDDFALELEEWSEMYEEF